MKKAIFFFYLFVAMATVVFGQDLKTIEKHFKENIENLDPIEGIYHVKLQSRHEWEQRFSHFSWSQPTQYTWEVRTSSDNYEYTCAIIRYDQSVFEVLYIDDKKSGKEDTGAPNYEKITVTKLGESAGYRFEMDYIHSRGYTNDKDFVVRNIQLESLFTFSLNVSIHRNKHYYTDIYGACNLNQVFIFNKEFPTISMYEEMLSQQEEAAKPKDWSGTGFAIGNGYIVTNNHVVDEANTIQIKGIRGDMNTGYPVEVVATDKVNDIAVLKIKDSPSKGFGVIPYNISPKMADVGEDVFVLGYPLTQALGNEIKLTNGIISSRTGYQGDVANYQMSAPVQPGNSGGPMFDSKGNVIGIVVAGVSGTENVGYAIKIAYLKLLIESAGLNIKFPANNTISTLPLSEKVKRVKKHVFYIECSR